jgi:hypothetical protein
MRRRDFPTKLLCAKGAAGLAFEHDDERPQTPLIRTGALDTSR